MSADSGHLPRKPGSSPRDRKRSLEPPCASNPPRYTCGPPRAAMTPTPEADALTAGPPLAHAHWNPTAAGSSGVPNRPASARPLLPLHRAPRRPFRRTHSPVPQPGPRDPPLTCRPVRLRELRREPPVHAAPLDASYNASFLSPTLVLLTGQLVYHSTEEEMMVGL